MSIFNVAFRIGENGNFDARYTSVLRRIREEAGGQLWAENENAGFVILESPKQSEDLANSIYVNSELHCEWDQLVVVDLSSKAYAVKGALAELTRLSELMAAR